MRALLSTDIGSKQYGVLLNQAGIENSTLSDPTGRVSIEQYSLLLQAIWSTIHDESFGFCTHPLKPGTFAMMCQTLLTADNLEHALRRVAKFYKLITDDFHFAVERHPLGARFELHIKGSLRGPESFFSEAIFALFLRLSAWLIDQAINPLHLSFRYPSAESSHSFEGRMSCPIRYQRPFSYLDFSRRSLDETIRRNSQDLKALLSKGPQHFLVDFRQQDRVSDRIKAHWNQGGDLLNTSLEVFAENFGLSVSTLRRKLREEGSNFHDLRENVRRDRSLYYLLHTYKSLDNIAALVGYSEPSTFHRAFKKWTGLTPRDFRQTQQKSSEGELSEKLAFEHFSQ